MNAPRSVAALAAVLLGLGAPVTSIGAPPSKAEEQKRTGTSKVLLQDELEVEGKVQKPSVKPITPPPDALQADKEKPGSFLPKIVKAVEKAPF